MDFPKGPTYHFELKPDLPSHALHPPFFFWGGGRGGLLTFFLEEMIWGFFGCFFSLFTSSSPFNSSGNIFKVFTLVRHGPLCLVFILSTASMKANIYDAKNNFFVLPFSFFPVSRYTHQSCFIITSLALKEKKENSGNRSILLKSNNNKMASMSSFVID